MFNNTYRGRKVLVTGHTGFKGSWLALWLQNLGAHVTGVALAPEGDPNHWALLKLDHESHFIDIRDETALRLAVTRANPEIVFHLAAQPLVRRSYIQPVETFATNVMGTANLLDACRSLTDLSAIVVVTTDKCYENKEWTWGYREVDPLGGHDPYSSSKAGTEIVAASFRRSFFNTPKSALLATARAGNVIGGGDWSEDRLIPDLVRALSGKQALEIRSPRSTRPWQHVLDCLSGYLTLGQALIERDGSAADAWNFGPDREGNRSVEELLATLARDWPDVNWRLSQDTHPHEAQLLQLDSSKSRQLLKWRPVWSFGEAVNVTARWYRTWLEDGRVSSEEQLNAYHVTAKQRDLAWA
ncbi:CDP-glucose 4,6-dehydratase (plasmid) [Rhizobium sp. CB3171]|uniref:CDP-glucose 4,6-dehydratase n=1 Tax=Rhizobium sp. CB3171 TaxID=3039157 RepID=UPI0024B23F17|nr:CDP-glucose 4,6-dehydratase [Rhizobium sp. CB3171]WFU05945.1 CDP-glucose 4,6-dehydratase [Rhizobium sp. CB3171]